MEIASAEDPQAAYQRLKGDAEQQRASRARKADPSATNPLIRPTTTDGQSQAKPALAPKAILRRIDEPAEPDEIVDKKEIDSMGGSSTSHGLRAAPSRSSCGTSIGGRDDALSGRTLVAQYRP